MQFEIPEDAHVHIVIGKPTSWDFNPLTFSAGKACSGLDRGAAGALLAVPGDATAVRPTRRFARPLLKGGFGVMLMAASFAAGHYSGSPAHSPDLARTAAALPRPSPLAEQHAFRDPQPREAPALTAGQVPAEFQRKLQQPPTVTPPPGQTGAPETPLKNPFGLEN